MGFINSRKNSLEKKISKTIQRHKNKQGFAIIFKEQDSSPYIYRFLGNTYVEARLDNMHWSIVKYIPDLTWEEAKKISKNIRFINPKNQTKWIARKKKSPLIAIKKKIHNLFLKKDTSHLDAYY